MPKTNFSHGTILEPQHVNDLNNHEHNVAASADATQLSERNHRKINIVDHTEGILPFNRVEEHGRFIGRFEYTYCLVYVTQLAPTVFMVTVELKDNIPDSRNQLQLTNISQYAPPNLLVFPAVYLINSGYDAIYYTGRIFVRQSGGIITIDFHNDRDVWTLARPAATSFSYICS